MQKQMILDDVADQIYYVCWWTSANGFPASPTQYGAGECSQQDNSSSFPTQ